MPAQPVLQTAPFGGIECLGTLEIRWWIDIPKGQFRVMALPTAPRKHPSPDPRQGLGLPF